MIINGKEYSYLKINIFENDKEKLEKLNKIGIDYKISETTIKNLSELIIPKKIVIKGYIYDYDNDEAEEYLIKDYNKKSINTSELNNLIENLDGNKRGTIYFISKSEEIIFNLDTY